MVQLHEMEPVTLVLEYRLKYFHRHRTPKWYKKTRSGQRVLVVQVHL